MNDYRITLNDSDFNSIRNIVVRNFGIMLSSRKKTLIVSRLKDYLNKREIENFSDYIGLLERDRSGKEISELVNRISTNHTFFFREKEHYSFFFNKALSEFQESLQDRDLRMWCAGCSYGDEPYSFQILLYEYFKDDYKRWKAGVLATDISEKALNIAKKGVFLEQRVKNVPREFLRKYFVKDDENWIISDKIKKEVVFRRFNLMNDNFPYKKKFHIISCRNVMIYFNSETRRKLIEKFYNNTEKGGYLFIGQSEYIENRNSDYRFVVPGVYRKGLD